METWKVKVDIPSLESLWWDEATEMSHRREVKQMKFITEAGLCQNLKGD